VVGEIRFELASQPLRNHCLVRSLDACQIGATPSAIAIAAATANMCSVRIRNRSRHRMAVGDSGRAFASLKCKPIRWVRPRHKIGVDFSANVERCRGAGSEKATRQSEPCSRLQIGQGARSHKDMRPRRRNPRFASLEPAQSLPALTGPPVDTRPDQHVAWRGDKLPVNPIALIDHVRGTSART